MWGGGGLRKMQVVCKSCPIFLQFCLLLTTSLKTAFIHRLSSDYSFISPYQEPAKYVVYSDG